MTSEQWLQNKIQDYTNRLGEAQAEILADTTNILYGLLNEPNSEGIRNEAKECIKNNQNFLHYLDEDFKKVKGIR